MHVRKLDIRVRSEKGIRSRESFFNTNYPVHAQVSKSPVHLLLQHPMHTFVYLQRTQSTELQIGAAMSVLKFKTTTKKSWHITSWVVGLCVKICFCKCVVAGMATSLGKIPKGVLVCSSPTEDLLKISFQFGCLSFAFQLVTLVICCFWCIHLLSWLKVVCKTQSSVHLVSLDSWSIMQTTFLHGKAVWLNL